MYKEIENMNVGFDLDGIFVSLPPFVPKSIIYWLYKGHDHGLFYRLPSKPEKIIRVISHYPFLRPPILENIEFVKKLTINRKHKYYLISSRFSFLKDQTDNIIGKYNLGKIFNSMFFNFKDQQPHIFKDERIKKMKIDRYVDDDLPLLEFVAKNNPKRKFFWLNNKQSKPLLENLFAIKHLSAMFKS